jgi:hypothetical protein
MTVGITETQGPVDWRRFHALGLPSGSVRALLAVGIFATTWGLLLFRPTQVVPDYLGDLLFIIMGHYFAVRNRAAQEREPGPPPLYLPRGSVRLVLVIGCVAVAVLLHLRGQLTSLDRNPGVVTLLLVGGFLLGVAVNAVTVWWLGEGHRPPRFVEDLRAILSLAAAILLIFLVWSRCFLPFPSVWIDGFLAEWIRLGRFGPEHVLAAIVGFYFGSRS